MINDKKTKKKTFRNIFSILPAATASNHGIAFSAEVATAKPTTAP